jgi:DNA modification methylase
LDESFQEKKGSPEYRPNDDGTAGIQSRLHGATVKGRNNHPTLKPIDLCKYLATLLLPPVEYAPRRIFVPFSGSGSEMIGSGLAGWEHVVGVEFDTENNYVEIAKKRLAHWLV